MIFDISVKICSNYVGSLLIGYAYKTKSCAQNLLKAHKFIITRGYRQCFTLLYVKKMLQKNQSGGKACNKTILYIDTKTWKLKYYLVLNLAKLKAKRWFGVQTIRW